MVGKSETSTSHLKKAQTTGGNIKYQGMSSDVNLGPTTGDI